MKRIHCARGFTVADIMNALLLFAVIIGMTATLGRRAVARYQLNSAARMLTVDMSRVKTQAIQTNAITTVAVESDRDYRASGTPRHLPAMVRFDASSSADVSFNGLGAVSDGGTRSFVLKTSFGEAREVFIYAAGGQEIRKL